MPTIVFTLLIQILLPAQPTLCGGTLGANIFLAGDFGSGSPAIYPEDPNLAPGFLYTTTTPPTDGTYILTNDMSKWPYHWPTWLQIGDNSDDPNGYMMVVNASETPGIFYEQVIDHLCENTLYEFSADAINLMRKNMGGILPDISFYINDLLQYTTGPVGQDEKWHTYGFTFSTGSGQSTLKLTLRNNAPGGGGNDLALDNIGFRACGPDANINLPTGGKFCANELPLLTAQIDADTGFVQWQISDDSLTWVDLANANALTYQIYNLAPGKHYFRFLYATSLSNLINSNCRIFSEPISFEVLPSYYTATATVCEGLSYAFGDSVYHEAGFYQHSFKREGECDSVVTLELILFPDPIIMAEYEIIAPSCNGAEDGSIRLLSVTGVEAPYKFTFNDSIHTPPQSSLIVPAGEYTAIVTNEYGCYDMQELLVPDGRPLQIKTIEDTSLLYGKRLLLSVSSNMPVSKVRWTPSTYMDCPTCLSTEVIIKEKITYIVEGTTATGCVASDSVTVDVSHQPVRYIPNVFSPNNDQVNDVFEIVLEPVSFISIDRIVVFDRWGGLLHQQFNIAPEEFLKIWDGYTAKGPVPSGVYFYSIDYTLIDGAQESIKGDVTVVK